MKIGSKTKVTREVTRQERNRRNNMKRITISALVAFILFVALTIIQSSILNQETKVSVYQVKKDIHEGTKITEENFDSYLATKDVQASLIPDGYITDKTLVIGKFINRNYKAKDVITVDGLNDSETAYNSGIKNPVKLSFSVSSLSDSVSGTLREGDYINIYGMRNAHNAAGEVIIATNAIYTFKHIYIEKAYNSSGDIIDSADRESEALMFTIIIEEGDVDLFNEMLANCTLKLVKIMYETDQDYKAFTGNGNVISDNTIVDYENTDDKTDETPSETEESTGDIMDEEGMKADEELNELIDKLNNPEEEETTTSETEEATSEATSETTSETVEN